VCFPPFFSFPPACFKLHCPLAWRRKKPSFLSDPLVPPPKQRGLYKIGTVFFFLFLSSLCSLFVCSSFLTTAVFWPLHSSAKWGVSFSSLVYLPASSTMHNKVFLIPPASPEEPDCDPQPLHGFSLEFLRGKRQNGGLVLFPQPFPHSRERRTPAVFRFKPPLPPPEPRPSPTLHLLSVARLWSNFLCTSGIKDAPSPFSPRSFRCSTSSSALLLWLLFFSWAVFFFFNVRKNILTA